MRKGKIAVLAAGAALLLAATLPARADESADSAAVVKGFVDGWTSGKSIDEITKMLDDKILYINVPDPTPIHGRKDSAKFLEPFFAKDPLIVPFEFKTEVKHLVANGPDVLLDRVDTITVAGKSWSVPVAAYFEVKKGKITVWKDYFDQGQFQAAATMIEVLGKKK